ncbi:meiotic recombination protein REC114-like isoform X2 [Mizuhopecten yessoensis]|uniref:Meiotic recombination protein REC114-like n=1 Tax=Mizuhopecten yessoensis TaxID=6573 RepID=A0A210QKX6_MIZYE|nr:meiotic recombination protein REC114-like isoform X2 [Mizuhopecten yessoensis]OWF49301.1 Meiotic recombination protein REC114-like [Mizuhopecten yessoensis]
MAAISTVWSLKRYARLRQISQQKEDSGSSLEGSWQEYHGDETPLKAMLHLNGQFVLTSGTTIMESIYLRSAGSWIRGTSKGDSVLIVCKLKEEARRFRLQFLECNEQSDVAICREFAERMSEYFPIKVLPNEKNITQSDPEETSKKRVEREVTLSKIAKVVTKAEDALFPAAYQKCCYIPSEQLELVLRLCLSDPTFPAFVEEVEHKLNKIKNN